VVRHDMEYVHSIHNIIVGDTFSLWTSRVDLLILYYQVRFAAGILRSNCIDDLRMRTLHWMLGLRDDDVSAYPRRSKYHINLGAGGGTRGIEVLAEMYVRRGCDLDPVGVDSHLL
jgi:hypothetical protein